MAFTKLRLLLWLTYVIAASAISNYRDGFEYPFVTPNPYELSMSRADTMSPWEHFYPANHDFTDYSQHITRTNPASRNSAAQLVPSGPYFAQELKNIYHKPDKRPAEHKVYQTSWNMIDSNGNEVTVYNRPGLTSNRPAPPFPLPSNHPLFMEGWKHQQHQIDFLEEQPIRKPLSKKPVRKKHKVRPIHPAGYQQHLSKNPNKYDTNDIDKMADAMAPQSIASAYPNGVMGTLSLMAGLVWYLVNKSATPVVKMRQHSDSNSSEEDGSPQNAINQLADYWLGSLKQNDCQQRAVCELVSQSPWLSSVTRWGQSAYRSPMVQKAIESLKDEEEPAVKLDDDQSKWALLVRAASQGERGVDCGALFPDCALPFGQEARDRRR